MRDYEEEMREYGMMEKDIQLAKKVSHILGKNFIEVVQTPHVELIEKLVDVLEEYEGRLTKIIQVVSDYDEKWNAFK